MSDTKYIKNDSGKVVGTVESTPYSTSSYDGSTFENWLFGIGAICGALYGIYIGFMHAGVGGAILGVVVGGILGALAARLLQLFFVLILLLGLVSIFSSLWGLGKPG